MGYFAIVVSVGALAVSVASLFLSFRKFKFDKSVYVADGIGQVLEKLRAMLRLQDGVDAVLRQCPAMCERGREQVAGIIEKVAATREALRQQIKNIETSTQFEEHPIRLKQAFSGVEGLLQDMSNINGEVADLVSRCSACPDSDNEGISASQADAPVDKVDARADKAGKTK